ncbi:MAG: hypothetical protein ACLSFT_04730 [Ruminococcus callidus]
MQSRQTLFVRYCLQVQWRKFCRQSLAATKPIGNAITIRIALVSQRAVADLIQPDIVDTTAWYKPGTR